MSFKVGDKVRIKDSVYITSNNSSKEIKGRIGVITRAVDIDYAGMFTQTLYEVDGFIVLAEEDLEHYIENLIFASDIPQKIWKQSKGE